MSSKPPPTDTAMMTGILGLLSPDEDEDGAGPGVGPGGGPGIGVGIGTGTGLGVGDGVGDGPGEFGDQITCASSEHDTIMLLH